MIAVSKLNQCQGTITAGRRCKKTQRADYCFQHLDQSENPPQPTRVQCSGVDDDGEQCKRFFSNGLKVCWEHREQDLPISVESVVAQKDATINDLSVQLETRDEQIEMLMNRIRELEDRVFNPPTTTTTMVMDEPTTDSEMADGGETKEGANGGDGDGDDAPIDTALLTTLVAETYKKVSKKSKGKKASKA